MKKYTLVLILILAAALRLFLIDKYPIGLNADEAAIAYNDYSLLKTGLDEHGTAWPLTFRSFDDYKLPMYFYLALPFIKTLGLTVMAVRLPSALAGILSVYLIYLVARKISSSEDSWLPEISALLLAISPWHLQFSRGAWEVNVATTFILLGFYFFLKSHKTSQYYYLFTLSLAMSLYTYHSARVVAPLLALGLFIIFRPKLSRHLVVACLVGLLVSVPVALQLTSREGQSRFSGVSIFADSGPLSYVLEMRRTDPNPNSFLTKLKYNRYSAYSFYFLKNYLSHFSFNFLFVSGDVIDRSRIPGFGQAYIFLAPFFYLGLISLLSKRSKLNLSLLLWLAVSPIAASLTFQSPHALRAANMAVPLTITTALGLIYVYRLIRQLKLNFLAPIFVLILLVAGVFEFGRYLNSYYYRYPNELPTAWQYGFKDLADYISAHPGPYQHIVISDRYDQPYILMAFYLKEDPKIIQTAKLTSRDKFGFSTITSYANFEFRPIIYSEDKKLKNTLLVAADENVPDQAVSATIVSPGGQKIFKIINLP